MQIEQMKKKRAFKKFSYRGVDLDKLLDLSLQETLELLPARIRRRFGRGITRKHTTLLKKLRKAVRHCCTDAARLRLCAHLAAAPSPVGVQKKEVVGLEKPKVIKTHLRDMPIIPGASPRHSRARECPPRTPPSPPPPSRDGRVHGWHLQRQGVQHHRGAA